MAQISSVERTTLIELFSTFFDRLSSNHPQRELMLKQLYQFKSHLYSNDPLDQYFNDLTNQLQEPKQYYTQQYNKVSIGTYQTNQSEQKSPFKRDNSQNRQQQKSLKKDDNNRSGQIRVSEEYQPRSQKTPSSKVIKNAITKDDENINQSINRLINKCKYPQLPNIIEKQNTIITSCNHEVDKDIFEQHVNQQLNETNQVKCPICNNVLPVNDYKQYSQINSFEEFKQKNISILKTLVQIDKQNEEFNQLINQFEQEERQKQSSRENSQSPIMGFSREEKIVNSSQMALQIMRKCLRCNKDIGNIIDSKNQISCFCQNCKNF